jgi:hypothetical protein
LLWQTTTDANGYYLFDALVKGEDYVAVVINDNVSDYRFTKMGTDMHFTEVHSMDASTLPAVLIYEGAYRLVTASAQTTPTENNYNVGLRDWVLDQKLAKPSNGTTVRPGDTIEYTIRGVAQTNGNLVIRDSLSSLVGVPEGITGGGSYNAGNHTITWTYPSLSAGDERTMTFKVKVAANEGTISNTAIINGAASNTIQNPIKPFYTITFIAGSGGSLSGQTSFPAIDPGTPWSTAISAVPTPVPENSHYSFVGWFDVIPATNSPITASKVYEARFAIDAHTVTYFGNGNTGGIAPAPVTQTHGSTVIVSGRNTLTRAGFTFLGWSENSSRTVVSYSVGSAISGINRDYNLYAVWRQNVVPSEILPDSDPDPEPDNESVVVADPIPDAPDPEDATPQQALNAAAAEQGIPDLGVPLRAPTGFSAWALLNLILTILGILLVIYILIVAAKRRREDDEEDENSQNTYKYANEDEEDEKKKKTRKLLLIIASILALLAVLLFILTEDMRLPMVWVDKWTIWQAIIFILEIVSARLAFHKKEEEDEEEEALA